MIGCLRLFAPVALVMLVAAASAGIYHLDPQGIDDASGGGQSAPWKTLTYAAKRLSAGDTLVLADGVYHERPVSINNVSGTAENPIVVRAAAGAQPVIDIGLVARDWQVHSGSICRATLTYTGKDSAQHVEGVVIDERPLTKKSTPGEIGEGCFAVDGTTLYAWAFDNADPREMPVTVVCGNKDAGNRPAFHLYRANHWEFRGLTVQGGYAAFWADDWSGGRSHGLYLYDCIVRYNLHFAVYMYNFDDVVVSGCDIYQNGLWNWPRTGARNWPHAVIGYNCDNVLIEKSAIHDNHGEGIGPFLSCNRWYMRDNVLHDNWSLNIYFDTQLGNSVAERNLCYNTGKYYSGDDWRNVPVHIGIHNENNDLGYNWPDPDNGAVDSIVVKNNICLGKGVSFRCFPYANGPSTYTNIVVAHNTFASDDVHGGGTSMRVGAGNDFRIVNNIISTGGVLLENGIGDGISFENNLVAGGTVTINGGSIAQSGTVVAPAGFVGGDALTAESYRLLPASAAAGAGVAVSEVTHDFYGATVSSPPDLGAIAVTTSTRAGVLDVPSRERATRSVLCIVHARGGPAGTGRFDLAGRSCGAGRNGRHPIQLSPTVVKGE